MRALALVAAVLGCVSAEAQSALVPGDRLPVLSDGEQAAVDALLLQHPGRRLLASADHSGPSLERYRRLLPGYEPYAARGDFDRDGRPDLVVALTGTDGFDVYLLHPATTRAAEWIAGLHWLEEAAFLVRKEEAETHLGIGSLFSDDAIWFGWNDDTAQMEALPSEMMDG